MPQYPETFCPDIEASIYQSMWILHHAFWCFNIWMFVYWGTTELKNLPSTLFRWLTSQQTGASGKIEWGACSTKAAAFLILPQLLRLNGCTTWASLNLAFSSQLMKIQNRYVYSDTPIAVDTPITGVWFSSKTRYLDTKIRILSVPLSKHVWISHYLKQKMSGYWIIRFGWIIILHASISGSPVMS